MKKEDIEDIEKINHFVDRLGYETADDVYFNTLDFGSKEVGRMLQDYAFGTPEDSLYTANLLESFLSKKHPEYGHDKIDKIIKDYEENLTNQVYASYGTGVHGTKQLKQNEEGDLYYTNLLGKFNPFRQDLNPGITEGRDTTFISSEIGDKSTPLGRTTGTADLLKTLYHETMHKFDKHPEHTDEEAYEEDYNLYDELVSNIVSKGTDYHVDPTKSAGWYQTFKNALFPKKVNPGWKVEYKERPQPSWLEIKKNFENDG